MNKNNTTPAGQKIIEVFLDLIRTTEVGKIRISEIIRRAEVNRSTFYRNFEDINDLYKHALAYVSDLLDRDITSAMDGFTDNPSELPAMFDAFVGIVSKHRDNFTPFIGRNARPEFMREMTRYFGDLFGRLGERFIWFRGIIPGFPAIWTRAVILATVAGNHSGEAQSVILKEFKPDEEYDFNRDILTNIERYCETHLSGNKELKLSLYRTVIRRHRKVGLKGRNLSVSLLSKESYISRALFYLTYSTAEDFIKEFASASCAVIASAVTDLVFLEPEDVGNMNFADLPEDVNAPDIIATMDYRVFEDFTANALLMVRERIINSPIAETAIKTVGRDVVDKYLVIMDYHLALIECTFLAAAVSRQLDSDLFKKTIRQIHMLSRYFFLNENAVRMLGLGDGIPGDAGSIRTGDILRILYDKYYEGLG